MRETIDVEKIGDLAQVVEMTDEEVLKREIFYKGIIPLKQHSYNGIVGVLPGWLDDFYVLKFDRMQRYILVRGEDGNGNAPEQVLKWMDTYCRLRNDTEFQITKDHFPNAHISAIEFLVYCRDIALLGKSDGLRVSCILANLFQVSISYRTHFPLNILNVYRPIELLNKYDKAGVKDFHSPFWKELLLITEKLWLLKGEPPLTNCS